MPMPIPYVMRKPRITLDADGATPIEISCSSNEVHAIPEADESTWETFCGSGTVYKAEVWTVELNVLQSFGTDGFWNLVRPLVGTVTNFELLPDADAAVGPGNLLMKGPAVVKPFGFLDGPIGEVCEITVEFGMQGTPEFLETAPAGAYSARADEDEEAVAA